MAATPEFHVVILWHNGLNFANEVIEAAKENFVIKKVCYIRWTPERFSENLRRFYGPEASLIEEKASVAGTGPFLALLLEDQSPRYDIRQTTDGPRDVNAAIFDFKSSFRSKLSNKWLLHSSVTRQEGIKDAVLLFHAAPQAVVPSEYDANNLQTLNQDPLGADGFSNLGEMFELLNHTMPYVLLFRRAYSVRDGAPLDLKEGGDFDLLTTDHLLTSLLLNAKARSPDKHRRNFSVQVSGQAIDVDIRDTFDGYFCPVWSGDILRQRRDLGGIFIPGEEDLFYSSLYHVCVHKGILDQKYHVLTLEAQKRSLPVKSLQDCVYHSRKFIVRSAYSAPTPSDPGVRDDSKTRAVLVRKAFVVAERDSARPPICPSFADLKASIPEMLDSIIARIASAPPLVQKRSDGWYESKIWKCALKTQGTLANVCVKSETFFSHEMRDHALKVTPSILPQLECDFVPRFYSHRVNRNTLITCTEWIDGVPLHDNINAVTADLVRSGEYHAFVETMYSYLDYLKRKRIEHRDIWEKNVIVRNRRPVFIDFTWSCVAGEDAYYPPLALFRNDAEAINRLIGMLEKASNHLPA